MSANEEELMSQDIVNLLGKETGSPPAETQVSRRAAPEVALPGTFSTPTHKALEATVIDKGNSMADVIKKCSRKAATPQVEKAEQKTTIRVDRPPPQSFFRMSPLEEHQLEMYTLVYPAESESKKDRQTYLVSEDLFEEGKGFSLRKLRLGVTREGKLFVWPMSLPNLGGWSNTWVDSAHECARQAETRWCCINSDTKLQRYTWICALGDFGEPTFPTVPFNEILASAFEGRIIASRDHDILRRLRGEI